MQFGQQQQFGGQQFGQQFGGQQFVSAQPQFQSQIVTGGQQFVNAQPQIVSGTQQFVSPQSQIISSAPQYVNAQPQIISGGQQFVSAQPQAIGGQQFVSAQPQVVQMVGGNDFSGMQGMQTVTPAPIMANYGGFPNQPQPMGMPGAPMMGPRPLFHQGIQQQAGQVNPSVYGSAWSRPPPQPRQFPRPPMQSTMMPQFQMAPQMATPQYQVVGGDQFQMVGQPTTQIISAPTTQYVTAQPQYVTSTVQPANQQQFTSAQTSSSTGNYGGFQQAGDFSSPNRREPQL